MIRCLAAMLSLLVVPTLAFADQAADECLARGRKLDDHGQHAEAIAAWKECLRVSPDNATLESEIGSAAFQVPDLDTAEKYARAAIAHAKDPNRKAASLYTLGRVQEERKDPRGAIASYRESATLRKSPAVDARLRALDPSAPTGTAPPAFAKQVAERAADAKMHVARWWQDDLDNDGQPDNIAFICNDDAGLYLIEYKGALLEAGHEIDGRNSCPDAETSTSSWEVEHLGYIPDSQSVHRASEIQHIAVRNGKPVYIYTGEDGADGVSGMDWENLATAGDDEVMPIVPITTKVRRWATVAKNVTMSATVEGQQIVLHVKSAALVKIGFCTGWAKRDSCKNASAQPRDGAADVVVPSDDPGVAGTRAHLKISVAGAASKALLVGVTDDESGYPSAAPPPR